MRSTQWVEARKKTAASLDQIGLRKQHLINLRKPLFSDTADARWLQAAPEHLGVTQHYTDIETCVCTQTLIESQLGLYTLAQSGDMVEMERDGSTDDLREGPDVSYKYWAFISYSHRDAQWAKWLHKRIEGYRLPTKLVQHSSDETSIPSKLAPVFRDQDELPTSSDLGTVIARNLEASRHLIVVCSPDAAQSRWVNEEILTFQRLERSDRIHLLIVDGEPKASAHPDATEKECFPSAITHHIDSNGMLSEAQIEPLAADARAGKDSRHDAMLRLISGMLGVGFDELKRRDLQRRQRRLLGTMIATIILALAMFGLTLAAVMGQREANLQRSKALAAQARSDEAALVAARERDTAKQRLARNYWNNAVAQRDSYHDLIKASHYFARAATEFSPSSPDAKNARLATAALVHNNRLEHILTHSDAVVGARLNEDETRFLTWCQDGSVALWDLRSAKQLLLVKHDRWVDDAMFGADEKSILTQGRDGAVRLWDAETGKLLLDLRHQGEVGGAVLSQDQSQVLSWAYEEKAALLWNVETGDVARRFAHDTVLMGAVFSGDERRILTWGYDGTVYLWDRGSDKPLYVLKRASPCYHATFNREESQILVSCEKAVFLWDPAQGTTFDIADFDGRVNGAAFDTEERQVVSWSNDGTVQVWRSRQGKVATFRHGGSVSGAVFAADERQVLSWSHDGTVRLWDTETQKEIVQFDHEFQVNGATFAGQDNRILSWGNDGTSQLWDAETARPLLQFRHNGPVFGATFSRDQRRLLTWGFDKTLRIWNLSPSFGFKDFKHDDLVWHAQFNLDFSRLLTSSGDKTARLWNVATGVSLRHYAHQHTVYGAAFNGDESRVLTWSRDGVARVWDAETGQTLGAVQHAKGVVFASFIDGSDSFISYGLDRTLRVWHAETRSDTVIDSHVSQVSFAQNARHVISWHREDNAVHLLECATGNTIATRQWREDQRIGAAFDASGERVLIWDSDRLAQVLDVSTGDELVQLKAAYAFQNATFDQGGRRIASWHLDEPVRVWDADSGTLVFDIPRERPVVDVAFSGDNSQILVISEDNSAQLWDAETGRALAQMKGRQWDHLPVFNKEGSRLLTSHRDGVARVWDTGSGDLLAELGRSNSARGAIFGDDDQILIWYQDGTLRLWDVRTEAILNPQSFALGVELRTGTRLNEFGELQVLTEEAWQRRKRD